MTLCLHHEQLSSMLKHQHSHCHGLHVYGQGTPIYLQPEGILAEPFGPYSWLVVVCW